MPTKSAIERKAKQSRERAKGDYLRELQDVPHPADVRAALARVEPVTGRGFETLYCWSCAARTRFTSPANGLGMRCTVCQQDRGTGKPTVCANCDGELPRHPEHDDSIGVRRLFCDWRCAIVKRAREGSGREQAIAERMGWT